MSEYYSDVNNNSSYSTHAYNRKTIYSKLQMSMMSIALLVAGFGFLFVGLVGFGFSYLFNSLSYDTNLLWGFVSIGGIASFVMYFIWMFRIQNASLAFQFITIILFCLSNAWTFGILFAITKTSEVVLAFGITGLILLISFIVAKSMSVKVAFSMGRLMGVLITVYFILLFFSLMSSLFFSFGFIGGYGSLGDFIYPVVVGISGLLTLLYLVYNLWAINQMDKFKLADQNPKLARNVAIFLGFTLLMNLLRIFYFVLSLLLRVRR